MYATCMDRVTSLALLGVGFGSNSPSCTDHYTQCLLLLLQHLALWVSTTYCSTALLHWEGDVVSIAGINHLSLTLQYVHYSCILV
jgi:hypothetical protein